MNSYGELREENKDEIKYSIAIPVECQRSYEHKEIGFQPLKVCLICSIEIPIEQRFVSLQCQHIFCLDCLQDYIESKMQSLKVLNIYCPQEGCREIFRDTQIKRILDESKYTKYQELVLNKMKNRSSGGKLCPKPGCARSIQLIKSSTNGDEDILCACGTQICWQCFNFSHPGKSCLQALDSEFETYAEENNIRFCMMCKTPVIHVEGCAVMTCCVCDYEWCWTCGKHYTKEHKCTGHWEPASPYIYQKRSVLQRLASTILVGLKTLLNIFFLPFRILIFYIFWPLMLVQQPPHEDTTILRSLCRSIKNILISGLIGLILLPLTLVYTLIYFFWNISIVVPCLKHELLSLITPTLQAPKRWMVGNIDKFRYTMTAMPDPEAQDHQHSIVVRINLEEEPNSARDGILAKTNEKLEINLSLELPSQSHKEDKTVAIEGRQWGDIPTGNMLYGDQSKLTEKMLQE